MDSVLLCPKRKNCKTNRDKRYLYLHLDIVHTTTMSTCVNEEWENIPTITTATRVDGEPIQSVIQVGRRNYNPTLLVGW